MRYTETELQELKDKNPLMEVLKQKGFKIVKRGNHYATLCPFHPDKNPSLIITPYNNLWNCLGCPSHNGNSKTGGNIFDFLMKYEDISFIGAVEQLRKRDSNQLSRQKNGGHAVNSNQKKQQPSLLAAKKKKGSTVNKQKLLTNVIDFYHKTFIEDKAGREYLRTRGITYPHIMETFKIGYANGTLFTTIPEDGEIVDSLKEIGILTENNRELFKDCVVFPIYDTHGNIVNIYGRKIIEEPIHHLYLPGQHKGIFNHHILKTHDEIILTESIIDSLSLYQAGLKNTIPCYGINGLTDDHIQAFNDNNTREIIILFDSDPAGKEAGQALQERLSSLLSCRIVILPENEDPNSYLLKNSPEDLEKLLYGNTGRKQQEHITPELTEDGFKVDICQRSYRIHGIEGDRNKLKATIRAQNTKKFHIDTVDLYQSRARRLFIRETAVLFKEHQEAIEEDLNKIITLTENYISSRKKTREQPVIVVSTSDRKEACVFGKNTNLIKHITSDIEQCGYIGEDLNKLLCYLAMTSRKMDDPLSVLIISGSGAGKTSLQDTILRLCPEEDALKLTSLTGKALFYKKEYSLSHKVLAIEEEAGAEDASYAIRNLISSKQLTIEATIKDVYTGKITTMENTVKGPTSVFKTTTNPDTDPETKSRFITLTIDESREQTRNILNYQRRMHTLDGYFTKRLRDDIIRKHRNFQRILAPVAVFNPYAELLSYSDERLLVRRDNPKYLSIINTIAFLHQMQRPIQETERNGAVVRYINVRLEDIQIANELANALLGRSLSELSGPSLTLLNRIYDMVIDIELTSGRKRINILFTRREIREYTSWSDYQIKTHIKQLEDLEYLIPVTGSWGKQFKYRLAYNGEGKDGKPFMPGLINVEKLQKKAQLVGLKT
ncbi:CHC2 zinc finger domain-containing protein [Chlamydiota bacterium]